METPILTKPCTNISGNNVCMWVNSDVLLPVLHPVPGELCSFKHLLSLGYLGSVLGVGFH